MDPDELTKNSELSLHVLEVDDRHLALRQLARNRVGGFPEDSIAAMIQLSD